jgi:hypothetical protein
MSKDVKTADFLNLPANSKQLKKKINSEIPRSGCLPKSHKHIKKHKIYAFMFFYVRLPTVIP